MNILFLYSEVMPYTIAGLRALTESYDVHVHVVRWDVKKLTPYTPPSHPSITYYLRSEFSDAAILGLVEKINPALCYISGWMDKGYLKAGKVLKKKGIPVLAGLDNQWKGTIRQRAGTLLSSLKVKPYFSHIFATGLYQYEFARKLGFPREKILMHAVTADVKLFESAFHNRKSWNKQILFAGRLNETKGITLLYEVFKELHPEYKEWKLVLIGNGPLKNTLFETDFIAIKDFMNSEGLAKEAQESAIFCLPSIKEPWGVVIHEFAAAGLPMLTSDICGANTEFVKHGFNGFSFKSGQKNSLKKYLELLMNVPPEKLSIMAERSNTLARHVTPQSWAATLMSVLT